MSDTPEESVISELLRAIGKVQAPGQRVLDGAREVLWSAIASEMLGAGPAGDRAASTGEPAGRGGEHQQRTRRGQRNQPEGQRRKSTGGEPDNDG